MCTRALEKNDYTMLTTTKVAGNDIFVQRETRDMADGQFLQLQSRDFSTKPADF